MAEIQPNTLADLLLIEVQPGWTKDRALITGGAALAMGAVLAMSATGYVALAPAASDGTEDAVAVLAEAADASADDVLAVVIARGAVVDVDLLVWPAGITEPQKAAALAQLEARGIVARTTV